MSSCFRTYVPFVDRGAIGNQVSQGNDQGEMQFILSVKEGKPEWNLLGAPGIENLPAVQWKLLNIGRMTPMKHREALRKLRDYLDV